MTTGAKAVDRKGRTIKRNDLVRIYGWLGETYEGRVTRIGKAQAFMDATVRTVHVAGYGFTRADKVEVLS